MMYPRKEFDEREKEYSVLLRRKLEEAEAMLLKLNPSRERSLALTKLDEALLWANVAIAAAGISADRESSTASEAVAQSWMMMSAPVMKKEVCAVSPGRTFTNNKKLQEAVDAALLNAKANGVLKEAQVRAARIAEPAEHELFRMEKAASEPNFEQVADIIQHGIEANAPKRYEIDLRFDIQRAVSKEIRAGIDQAVAEFTAEQEKKEVSKWNREIL